MTVERFQPDATPPSEAERKLVAWIEQNVGPVTRCEAHARWRPGWFVDVLRDGEPIELYVRGERLEPYPPWPLEREAGVLQILERHGVLAPHIYGVCEDPHAIVMSNAPGRHNLATATDDAERVAVKRHLAEAMARMHAIDPAEAAALGMRNPTTDEEISLPCFDVCDAIYSRGKSRPDPRIEFLRRWVIENVPKNRSRISLVQVDSGQFLFKDGAVTSLLDFEWACLGDPMIDLAVLAIRAAYEPMGDLAPLFERYAELTGEAYDVGVLCYHLTWWSLATPMIAASDLAAPAMSANYADYIAWYLGGMIGALEAFAEATGVDLDKPAQLLPQPSRWAPIFDVLAGRIGQTVDGYECEQQRTMVTVAGRISAHSAIEAQYLRDASRLLGCEVETWHEADQLLEAFVRSAGAEHNAALARMFYHWCHAQAQLVEGLIYMPNFVARVQRFSEIVGGLRRA